jgi:hypothetical protein
VLKRYFILIVVSFLVSSCKKVDVEKVETSSTEEHSENFKYEQIEIEPSPDDKIFIREYTYQASEDDSKNSSRQKAVEQLKILLSQEVGTHIESYLEIKKQDINGVTYKSVSHEIKALSSAITKLKVIDEKWKGKEYWVKASVRVNEKRTSELLLEAMKSKANREDISRLNTLIEKQKKELKTQNSQVQDMNRKLVAQEIINEARKSEVLKMKRKIAKYQEDELYKIDETKLTKIEKVKLRLRREKLESQKTAEQVCEFTKGFTRDDVESIVGKPKKGCNNSGCANWQYYTVSLDFKDNKVVSINGCSELQKEVEQDRAIARMRYREDELLEEAENQIFQIKNSPSNTKVEWVQPVNKKEPCKVYVSFSGENPTLDPSYKLYWDGECKDGFAYGLGREIIRSDSKKFWQLGFYEKGEPQKYCVAKYESTNKYWAGDCIYDENVDEYGVETVIEYDEKGDLESAYWIYQKRASKNNPIKLGTAVSPFWNVQRVQVKKYPNFYYKSTYFGDNNSTPVFTNLVFEIVSQHNHAWQLVLNSGAGGFLGQFINGARKLLAQELV